MFSGFDSHAESYLPCPISSSSFIASVFVPRFGLDRYMHSTFKKSSSHAESIWRDIKNWVVIVASLYLKMPLKSMENPQEYSQFTVLCKSKSERRKVQKRVWKETSRDENQAPIGTNKEPSDQRQNWTFSFWNKTTPQIFWVIVCSKYSHVFTHRWSCWESLQY